MRELSIFIDESGDFGEVTNESLFYIVVFVFHNQAVDILENINKLETWLTEVNINDEYIHTHPIIRREYPYHNMTINERRKILNKMLRFTMSCNIKYFSIVVNRKDALDKHSLSASISKQLSRFIDEVNDYFYSFDHIIVYYDNGQSELSYILNAILNVKLTNVEFKNASPKVYKLLQVADFICSIELLRQKRENNLLTKSEISFFYKPNEIQKNYIKSIERKRFK